ncbi:MAG: PD-(D/E)XK nuclease family protein [Clostridiales bacterium]|nr:PD-(D/E)XK nuclease family protein [Clostridiales bacterium]
MSLQFIIGSSGAGKSFLAFQNLIEDASAHPERLYYVIVPEQFTMQTQKTLVEMTPGKGILNIDVLSFQRLAFRVLEEVGGGNRRLLDDTGKIMVLKKVVQQHASELPYLGSQMGKPGYLDEMKSLLSEFMQYGIGEEELEDMLEQAKDRALLHGKLADVRVLYGAFRKYLSDHYMTGEEVMDALEKALPFSRKLKDSVLLLDGFTGFTPIQIRVIRELLLVCRKVTVSVTMDPAEDPMAAGKPHQLFYMSRKMIQTLGKLTRDLEAPILVKPGASSRLAGSPALQFLEQHLFRYRRGVYEKEPEEIRIFSASTPRREMEETVRRIGRLVREGNYRYGEIAVITGNLEEYGSLARQIFSASGIPCFIDEKHTVLMNPFVEYLRAVTEMAVQDFSYESVFRYLRCGLSGLARDEIDELENYCLALGIRGRKRWSGKWVRLYRGMNPEDIVKINEIREHFYGEVEALALCFSGGRRRVREYCQALYEFAVKSQVQEKLKVQERIFQKQGDRAMEKEYGQIYGIVMNLLDQMVEILGEETVSRQEFRQLLETGLGKAQVALIPPGVDQVLVGDMERTRLKDIRALFFVGVNEGNIPKTQGEGGILTELDREFFQEQGVELAPGPRELMNTQRFYLYLNLTRPRERLCLSYSRTDSKGEAKNPAFLIGTIRGLFPRLEVETAEAPLWKGKEPEPSPEGAGSEEEREAFWDEVLPEQPSAGLAYFLELLGQEDFQKNNVFRELYSWYLRSPQYQGEVRSLVQASCVEKPADRVSKSVAKVLYGQVSPYSATRLERFSACAYAHFLQYGLRLTQREEYEFQAMDMGNVMHLALEKFAREVRKKGLDWGNLEERVRDEIIDRCLEEIGADYGNTILQSSSRNAYVLQRTRRLLRRTVWAISRQFQDSSFRPEGFEVSFGGGRIDRVDVMKEKNRVYVRVVDYKTGNTSFDLVELYHGLQLQLMIYLDGALQVEKEAYPDREVVPAGVFYYNIKDPLIQDKINADVESVRERVLKELKMNGLVKADPELIEKMDRTQHSIPVSFNKDGSFSRWSSVADSEQFEALGKYVRRKIEDIRGSILSGNVEVNPYELGNKNACTWCPYGGSCGFDRKIPGYEFRHLRDYSREDLWKRIFQEGEESF